VQTSLVLTVLRHGINGWHLVLTSSQAAAHSVPDARATDMRIGDMPINGQNLNFIHDQVNQSGLGFIGMNLTTKNKFRDALASLSRVKGLGARKAQGSPPRNPDISI